MKYYFDRIKSETENEISKANDRVLRGDSYSKILLKKHSINFPQLDQKSIKTNIGKEKLSMQTAPPEFSFSPGTEYEYAKFSVPVIGDLNFFKEALNGYRFDRFFQFQYDKIVYIVFSKTSITNNENEINRIRDAAKEKFESIENTLSRYEESIANFNQELENFIAENIQAEIQKRDSISNSERQLNPFN